MKIYFKRLLSLSLAGLIMFGIIGFGQIGDKFKDE